MKSECEPSMLACALPRSPRVSPKTTRPAVTPAPPPPQHDNILSTLCEAQRAAVVQPYSWEGPEAKHDLLLLQLAQFCKNLFR